MTNRWTQALQFLNDIATSKGTTSSDRTRQVGLIVSATANDGPLSDWISQPDAAAACSNRNTGESGAVRAIHDAAAEQAKDAAGGTRFNAMIKPFSRTSLRAAIWTLSPGTTPGTSLPEQSCLFRAMINSWRDAGPNGDYPFMFVSACDTRVPCLRICSTAFKM